MLTLLCAAVLAAPAPGAGLGKTNSIKVEFRSVAPIEVQAPSCSSPATGAVTLAPPRRDVSKAFGITVLKPKVGDLDDNDFARVTTVQVSDQTITVTSVVNQPSQCTGSGGWKARFKPDIVYARRVQVRVRPDLDKKPAKLRPRSMRIFDMDTLRRIRWKRFGGKTASGTAKYRSGVPGCAPKGCPGHNRRVKLRLRRVRRCQDSGILEYTQLDVIFRGRVVLPVRVHC
jgi:hypothetical protein